jgi:hypothetical protein
MDDDAMEYKPYGGATSFAEIEAYLSAQELMAESSEYSWQFRTLMENIMCSDMSDADKKTAMSNAVDDLHKKLTAPAEKGEKGEKDSLFSRVKRAFLPKDEEKFGTSSGPLFGVKKLADGSYRWIGVYSNQFEDRSGEIFSEAAHREFAEYAEKNNDYPVLQLWHTPGTEIGVADFIDYHDGFALASGTFNVDVPVSVMETLSKTDLAMSHGYAYKARDLKGGVYQRYRSREVSILPRAHAANPLTAFGTLEVLSMDATKQAFLEEVLGSDEVANVKTALTELKGYAMEKGLNYKSLMATLAEAPTPTPAPTPAPTQTATKEATPTGDGNDALITAFKSMLDSAIAPLATRLEAIEALVEEEDAGEKSVDDLVAEELERQILGGRGTSIQAARNSATYGNKANVVDEDDEDLVRAKKSESTDDLPAGIASEYGSIFGATVGRLLVPAGSSGKR